MIFSLFACIYITTLSWGWGMLLLIIFMRLTKEEAILNLDFAVTCFCGIAFIAVAAGFISLFLPLGGWSMQLIFIIPPLAFVFTRQQMHSYLFIQLRNAFGQLHLPVLYSLIASLLVSLIMNAGEIIHPDTLHYHAQCIQWIASYKVIPGLVNLGYHYGLQSSWFTASALFGFKYSGPDAPNILSIAVISWFIIFIHEKINRTFDTEAPKSLSMKYGITWLTLFVLSFWSFNMMRGALTSASPDFITAIYIWLVFYLFAKQKPAVMRQSFVLLILFIGMVSLTIKLSAAPAAVFSAVVYLAYAKRNIKTLLQPIIIAVLAVTPYITRNIITSGYPFFPLTFPNVIYAKWKAPQETMADQSEYIKAYARVGEKTTSFETEALNHMQANEWIPLWWQNQSISDKVILASLMALLIFGLIFFKKTNWKTHRHLMYMLIAVLAAIVIWLIQAPDPRFGFGYIIPAIMILQYTLPLDNFYSLLNRRMLSGALVLFSVVLLAYGTYRAVYHLKIENLLTVAGIAPVTYQTFNCFGIPFRKPYLDQCGNTRLPCIYGSCNDFAPRGKHISDGFLPVAVPAK